VRLPTHLRSKASAERSSEERRQVTHYVPKDCSVRMIRTGLNSGLDHPIFRGVSEISDDYFCREMPSFCIRDSRVVGLRSRI